MEKINYPEIFANFEGREHDLRQVTRYHIYSPMYYRTNLFTHSKHVLWLLQSILPLAEKVFGSSFDSTKVQLMAAVHDDMEIVMGDVQAGHKIKMAPAQLAEVANQEQNAIAAMSARFPYKLMNYSYEDLLKESQELQTTEAKFLKYVDRFAGFGEALHEVYAGNRAFTTHSTHEELGLIDLPVTFYHNFFANFPQKFPEFVELLNNDHPMFAWSEPFDMENTVAHGVPHAKDSLENKKGYTPYDFWRQLILNSNDAEEIENLYIQKEF